MTPLETLQALRDRLGQSSPMQVIDDLVPWTDGDALTWTRRLPAWEDYRDQFPDQVIGVARTISRRAMREYGLSFNDEGQVVKRQFLGKPWQSPKPSLTFRLVIGGEELCVEYTREYFPKPGTDCFSFTRAENHPGPHCLSGSGYLGHLAQHDHVEACGGPEAFARLFAEAAINGQERMFEQTFEGTFPDAKGHRRKPEPVDPAPAEEPPVVEEPAEVNPAPPAENLIQHAAQVIERRGRPEQGLLF